MLGISGKIFRRSLKDNMKYYIMVHKRAFTNIYYIRTKEIVKTGMLAS